MEPSQIIENIDDENDTIPTETNPPKKKVKKGTSDVWKFFTKLGKGVDGIERAACIGCKQEFKCGSSYGTSHLHRHIASCKNLDIDQMLINQEGKSRSKKIDQAISHEMCAHAIIEHDLPYSFVEYSRVVKWVKYLNPDLIMPSRNTIVFEVQKVYEKEKEKLKKIMANIPNRVCLTSDLWTACTSQGYICLTAHFVDDNWMLNSKILNFCRMLPPHTGFELANTVIDCLKEWGLEKKVFSLTLDNALVNDNMQDILKSQLNMDNSLLCDGQFFHIRCCAHILNLIVQEGMKASKEALQKIRESVKYVKSSDGRMKKFEQCVRESGGVDTKLGLRQDVSTRWNSTYLMLESVLHYQKAFSRLQLTDKHYQWNPSIDEWKRAMKMCEFLEPFYETTNLISGTSYPTSNLYFHQVWKIECILKSNLICEDEVIRDMAHKMKVKFDKYWHEYSYVLAFGAVLDPRGKLEFLEYCYSKVDPHSSEEKVQLVKTKLYELFKQYEKKNEESSSSQPSIPSSLSPPIIGVGNPIKKSSKIFCGFRKYKRRSNSSGVKSELDQYLNEDTYYSDFYEDLDVLQYWKGAEKHFPTLSIMARDVLSIPITTLASEGAFSIGSRVLTKYRSSILPKKVQMLICTRNWLHGFKLETNDDEDGSCDESDSPISLDEE